MSWSERFDEPIELTKDTALFTLRDAANHFIDLPASESIREHWQLARRFLVSAAEGNYLLFDHLVMGIRPPSREEGGFNRLLEYSPLVY